MWILRKDLPFAKKGEEVVMHNGLYCVKIDTGFWFIGKNNWDMSEWIEEVKSREWDVWKHKDIGNHKGYIYMMEPSLGEPEYEYMEKIRVREI